MAENKYKKYYDWIPLPVRVIGAGFLVYSGYKWVRQELDQAEANRRRRALEDSTVNYVYETPTGQVYSATIDLGTIAATINDALNNTGLIWWDEDEDRAIAAILQVPREQIPALENLYFRLYDEPLRQDFIDSCNEEQFAKVKHLFS